MENPILNLAVKAVSAIACFLLLAGLVLIYASYIEITESSLAGVVTISLAALFAIVAIASSNAENSKLRQEHKAAISAAQQLSQGELFKDDPEGELLDALRGISDYLKQKSRLVDRVARGNFMENSSPLSESDVLGRSIRKMTVSLKDSIQSQEDREKLHLSIMKLLDEVSEVSAGDLTVHADEAPEITGSIADAFNSMTQNLRSLIKQVKDITQQVGSSATSIYETTEQLASGSVAQAAQITRTTAAISKMAAQIQEVSENAEMSSQVASESLTKARTGTKAATDNINAMRCIRKQVQETAKRIKRLGERSQEISQIVGLIDDLSDRTSLLALNASLQASATGQAGTAFTTVTEEVERLAERSSRLTKQISALTQAINLETKEVVSSMEDTVHEVVVGSALADKAGRSLFSIESTSIKLADLIHSISDSARYQAKSSEDISNAMASISEVTEIVEHGSKRAAESVRTLVRLSDELKESVSPFKLPEDILPSQQNTVGKPTFLH